MATNRSARGKRAQAKVNRAECLKNPLYYASLANDRRRVFVIGETGEVVKVIGGPLNHKQTIGRQK